MNILNRSHVCVALIFCTSLAVAQDTPAPSNAGGESPSSATPAGGMQLGTEPSSVEIVKKTTTQASDQDKGFFLPGGSGYAPLNFTPGQGLYDRKPFALSTTIQQGYDDNVDSSSGKNGQLPRKGSALTNLSEGMDILFSQSRMGLSLGANAGAQYYWTRPVGTDQLTPTGGLNLLFAYKLTPRAQFSAVVNSVYTTQPTLTVVNGLTQSNGSGYLVTNSKFDLLYMWTPRFSTDTNYSANGAWYQASTQKGSNYIDQTVGQTLRYAFSPVVTGVIDGRYSHISYKGVPGSTFSNDSDTIYALVGADVTLTRRLSASGRVGETTRDYVQAGLASSSSPYAETSLNYLLSRTSIVALDARYGYENGGNGGQSSKSIRTGINYTQSFTSKLRGTAGMNYTHVGASSEGLVVSEKQDALGLSLGAQYAVSKTLNVFANINRVQNFSSNDAASYYKDVFFLGATLQY